MVTKYKVRDLETSTSASLTILKPSSMWSQQTVWKKLFHGMGFTDHLTCFLGNLYAGQEGS